MNGTKLPTATRAAAIAADGQYDQLALQLLDSVVRGDFDAATAYFDSEMQQKLTPPVIAAMWAAYQNHFGNYQSHSDPQDVPVGDFAVVRIPLQMQRSPGEFRVSFNNTDGAVAGLFVLKPGLPVP